MSFQDYFQGKKITVMGLGLLGRGVGDVKWLAEQGADLIVTDLKTEKQLQSSLERLRDYPDIQFVLGEHRLDDFRDRDMILKSAGVPLDSLYVDEARGNGIPIEMSAALLAKNAGVETVGITGTRGKSTVTHLIAHTLREAGKHVVVGGNVRGVANLPLFDEIRDDSILVMELDSWQLQGFGESRRTVYGPGHPSGLAERSQRKGYRQMDRSGGEV